MICDVKACRVRALWTCLLTLVLTFTACEKNDSLGVGYLQLGELKPELAADAIVTRSVDEGLTIDVVNEEGDVVLRCEAGDETIHGKHPLSEGEYRLRVYSKNYNAHFLNDDLGAPKYFAEQNIVIQAERTTHVNCTVPMINCAWTLLDIEGSDSWVAEYTYTIGQGERVLQLNIGETAYLEEGTATYHLTLTNTDGETNENNGTLNVERGKHYQMKYILSQGYPQAIINKKE